MIKFIYVATCCEAAAYADEDICFPETDHHKAETESRTLKNLYLYVLTLKPKCVDLHKMFLRFMFDMDTCGCHLFLMLLHVGCSLRG